MQFTSQQAGVTRPFQCTYAHVEDLSGAKRPAQHVLASRTRPSPRGLAASTSLQLVVEKSHQKRKKKRRKSRRNERVWLSPLGGWPNRMKWSKHINYSSQSKDSIALMRAPRQGIFSLPDPSKSTKLRLQDWSVWCFFLCSEFFILGIFPRSDIDLSL